MVQGSEEQEEEYVVPDLDDEVKKFSEPSSNAKWESAWRDPSYETDETEFDSDFDEEPKEDEFAAEEKEKRESSEQQ